LRHSGQVTANVTAEVTALRLPPSLRSSPRCDTRCDADPARQKTPYKRLGVSKSLPRSGGVTANVTASLHRPGFLSRAILKTSAQCVRGSRLSTMPPSFLCDARCDACCDTPPVTQKRHPPQKFQKFITAAPRLMWSAPGSRASTRLDIEFTYLRGGLAWGRPPRRFT
jgi:hypothetical protein